MAGTLWHVCYNGVCYSDVCYKRRLEDQFAMASRYRPSAALPFADHASRGAAWDAAIEQARRRSGARHKETSAFANASTLRAGSVTGTPIPTSFVTMSPCPQVA